MTNVARACALTVVGETRPAAADVQLRQRRRQTRDQTAQRRLAKTRPRHVQRLQPGQTTANACHVRLPVGKRGVTEY